MPLCEYGCGREAIHKLKNGKHCCEPHYLKCPFRKELSRQAAIEQRNNNCGMFTKESRMKQSEIFKGRISWNKGIKNPYSEETIEKMSESHKGQKAWNKGIKGQVPWNKGRNGIYSKETLKKMSINKKGKPSPWASKPMSEETKRKVSQSKKGHRSGMLGKTHSQETKRLLRLKKIAQIEKLLNNGHQIHPAFNPAACALLDEYGKEHGYNFKHAMNGGEYYFKELGYWVDGYDPEKNVVIEIDEPHHFDVEGNLTERDIRRQREIEEHCGCTFIRIRI